MSRSNPILAGVLCSLLTMSASAELRSYESMPSTDENSELWLDLPCLEFSSTNLPENAPANVRRLQIAPKGEHNRLFKAARDDLQQTLDKDRSPGDPPYSIEEDWELHKIEGPEFEALEFPDPDSTHKLYFVDNSVPYGRFCGTGGCRMFIIETDGETISQTMSSGQLMGVCATELVDGVQAFYTHGSGGYFSVFSKLEWQPRLKIHLDH